MTNKKNVSHPFGASEWAIVLVAATGIGAAACASSNDRGGTTTAAGGATTTQPATSGGTSDEGENTGSGGATGASTQLVTNGGTGTTASGGTSTVASGGTSTAASGGTSTAASGGTGTNTDTGAGGNSGTSASGGSSPASGGTSASGGAGGTSSTIVTLIPADTLYFDAPIPDNVKVVGTNPVTVSNNWNSNTPMYGHYALQFHYTDPFLDLNNGNIYKPGASWTTILLTDAAYVTELDKMIADATTVGDPIILGYLTALKASLVP